MSTYLLYLLLFFGLPVAVLMWLQRHELLKYKRTVLWCLVFVFTFGWVWDWLAVKTGVWRYDSAATLDIWLFGLPIEEFVGFYVLGTLLIVNVVFLILQPSRKA